MRKILQIFQREYTNLQQTALLLGGLTLVSQILGLIRDRILAGQLGVGQELDIYYSAFRIPDLIFALVASLVSVTILIPFFIAERNNDNEHHDQSRHFLNQIFTVFGIGMIIICVIAWICMPLLTQFIAPGFSDDVQHTIVMMSRLMLVSPALLGLSNLFGTVTQVFKKFFVYALAPVLYNIGLIIGAGIFYPIMGIWGLAGGVMLGAFFHFIIQVPVLIQTGYRPRFTSAISWKKLCEIIQISLPRTLTLSLNQIVKAFLLAMGSFLPFGSVTIFNFAWNLQNVPLALIGMSFSVAAFPTLVSVFQKNDQELFIRQMIAPARQIIFWSIPIIVFFIILRAHIVRVILGAGSFSWDDTRLTAGVLALFIISLVFQNLSLLFVRGYYAAGKTWRPFFVTLVGTGVSIVSSIGFYFLFHTSAWVQVFLSELFRVPLDGRAVIVLFAGAFALGEIVRALMLWFMFKIEFIRNYKTGLRRVISETTLASLIMGGGMYGILLLFSLIFPLQTFWQVFLQGFVVGILGIGLLILVLHLLRNKELQILKKAIRTRVHWKTAEVLSDVDELV